MKVSFSESAWEDFQYWLATDKRLSKKILQLIKDIQRNPFDGLGKPEPLRHELSGHWSRRIDDEHRLVYRVDDATVTIIRCRYHY